MMGDLLLRTLRSPSRLVPLDALLRANAGGSRMPQVLGRRLNADLADRLAAICPTEAMRRGSDSGGRWFELDYGECIGCGRCAAAAPEAVLPAVHLEACGVRREGLVHRWNLDTGAEIPLQAAEPPRLDRWLGRAVNIRQLDAGSCNGCEAEIAALTNPYYDLERWGAHFVASPKHADLLLVTGPVTRNMAEAVRQTYAALPAPKLVVAVGACGCSGGVFAASPAVAGGVDQVIPVDAYIPGCPPTPAMLLAGLAAVLRRRLGRRGADRVSAEAVKARSATAGAGSVASRANPQSS